MSNSSENNEPNMYEQPEATPPVQPDVAETDEQKEIVERVKVAREEYTREIPLEYEAAGAAHLVGLQHISYVGDLEHSFKKMERFNINYAKGKKLIDLGCGGIAGYTRRFAQAHGAEGYVGVDIDARFRGKYRDEARKQHREALLEWLSKKENENVIGTKDPKIREDYIKKMLSNPLKKPRKAPSLICPEEEDGFSSTMVEEDMLTTLGKMKTEGNKFFVMAGIQAGYDEYWDYLAEEMDRLASDGDAILSVGDFKKITPRLAKKGWGKCPFVNGLFVKGMANLRGKDWEQELRFEENGTYNNTDPDELEYYYEESEKENN